MLFEGDIKWVEGALRGSAGAERPEGLGGGLRGLISRRLISRGRIEAEEADGADGLRLRREHGSKESKESKDRRLGPRRPPYTGQRAEEPLPQRAEG